jgi:hypothetical protein
MRDEGRGVWPTATHSLTDVHGSETSAMLPCAASPPLRRDTPRLGDPPRTGPKPDVAAYNPPSGGCRPDRQGVSGAPKVSALRVHSNTLHVGVCIHDKPHTVQTALFSVPLLTLCARGDVFDAVGVCTFVLRSTAQRCERPTTTHKIERVRV